MKLAYSIGTHGTIYIWDEKGEHILHVIENKEELKALLDILRKINKEI